MNDILPPKPPLQSQPSSAPEKKAVPEIHKKPQILLEEPERPILLEAPKKRPKVKLLLWILGIIAALVLVLGVGVVVWYQSQLRAVDPNNTNKIRLSIASGSSPSQIGTSLREKGLIRSGLAFDIYTRITGVRSALQAGTYSLSPSETTPQIVTHLTAGKTDEFSITFLPGATLAENREGLIKAGYSADNVDQALEKRYDHPLFTDKPASTDLEGYIYGETYSFESSAAVEEILTRTFDEYYQVIKEHNLVELYKQQGLNLYQGITLASIIQREVPGADDQKQVAQVFYSRLHQNMPLGSDVTYQYAAKKLGVSPTPLLESPYNTRKYPGLPPGPIAVPGLSALLAVAQPASGDYLYFLSGDDDRTYFARTDAEHQANIHNHCQQKCSIL